MDLATAGRSRCAASSQEVAATRKLAHGHIVAIRKFLVVTVETGIEAMRITVSAA
jgi:hypothetical protein